MSDHKICGRCFKTKNNSLFRINKSRNKLISWCRECENEYNKIYKASHKEDIKAYNQEYFKEYYIKNQDQILEYQRQFYIDHKDEINIKNKNRAIINKEKIKEYKNNWEKEKTLNDPAFKLRKIVSASVRHFLNKEGKIKRGSILEYLPYSIEELKYYISGLFESWMNWNNWKPYDPNTWNDNDPTTWTWNLDHIIPQSKLPYTSMEDENFKKCWALKNLRPYSAKQNILDGAR